MFSMFARKPEAPPKVASDEVVSLPFFDDALLLAKSIHSHMYVFDKVLDVDKLEDAIERGLEFHIPTEFSKTRPLITRTRTKYETTIAGHPIGCRIPKPSDKPTVTMKAENLGIFFERECPSKLDDYIYQDRSVFGVHIVTFRDATLLITYGNHTAMDGFGRRAIFDAWILMLQGKEDAVPSPVDFHEDPLSQLGTDTSISHKLSSRRVSTFGLIGWALNNIVELAIRRPETRLICLPAGFVEKMRAAAMDELAATQTGTEKAFVSDGDIVVAWLARLSVHHLPPSNRNVTLQNVYSCRQMLTGSMLPKGRPYLSNCVAFFYSLLPIKDVMENPLSHTAQQVRTALQEQCTREQTEAYFSMVRETAPKKLPPMFGDSSMHLMIMSNWVKSNFFNLDFSAACVEKCDHPVTPRYIHAVQSPPNFKEMYIIVGKDAHGNYWLSACRSEQNWAVAKDAIERGDYMFEKQ
uniref:DmxR2 n=1 Tax=Cryptosporiopsis sp. (strain 8999) TaxID=2572248 RepID=A0A4P8DJX7_CRYX8|nr:DmxR2 [Cryptosporiopsis sp. 8999]